MSQVLSQFNICMSWKDVRCKFVHFTARTMEYAFIRLFHSHPAPEDILNERVQIAHKVMPNLNHSSWSRLGISSSLVLQ